MQSDETDNKMPFLAIPGRHITPYEAVEAIVAGLLIGTSWLWHSDIASIVQCAVGLAAGMTNTKRMVSEAEDINESNSANSS
jgi:hypothetical protein